MGRILRLWGEIKLKAFKNRRWKKIKRSKIDVGKLKTGSQNPKPQNRPKKQKNRSPKPQNRSGDPNFPLQNRQNRTKKRNSNTRHGLAKRLRNIRSKFFSNLG